MAESIVTKSATLNIPYSSSSGLVDGKIYILAQYIDTSIQRYDPAADTVTAMTATMPVNISHAPAVTINGEIFIFGGYDYGAGSRSNKIYKYDPSVDTIYTMTATLPISLDMPSAVAIGTDVYILGGSSSAIYKYDTLTDTVTTMAATFSNYTQSSAFAAGDDGCIYVFGGDDVNTSTVIDLIYKYNPETDSLVTLASTLPYAADYIAAAAQGDKIFVFGDHGVSNHGYICIFDVTAQTVSASSVSLPANTNGFSAQLTGDGNIYVLGGDVAAIYAYNSGMSGGGGASPTGNMLLMF